MVAYLFVPHDNQLNRIVTEALDLGTPLPALPSASETKAESAWFMVDKMDDFGRLWPAVGNVETGFEIDGDYVVRHLTPVDVWGQAATEIHLTRMAVAGLSYTDIPRLIQAATDAESLTDIPGMAATWFHGSASNAKMWTSDFRREDRTGLEMAARHNQFLGRLNCITEVVRDIPRSWPGGRADFPDTPRWRHANWIAARCVSAVMMAPYLGNGPTAASLYAFWTQPLRTVLGQVPGDDRFLTSATRKYDLYCRSRGSTERYKVLSTLTSTASGSAALAAATTTKATIADASRLRYDSAAALAPTSLRWAGRTATYYPPANSKNYSLHEAATRSPQLNSAAWLIATAQQLTLVYRATYRATDHGPADAVGAAPTYAPEQLDALAADCAACLLQSTDAAEAQAFEPSSSPLPDGMIPLSAYLPLGLQSSAADETTQDLLGWSTKIHPGLEGLRRELRYFRRSFLDEFSERLSETAVGEMAELGQPIRRDPNALYRDPLGDLIDGINPHTNEFPNLDGVALSAQQQSAVITELLMRAGDQIIANKMEELSYVVGERVLADAGVLREPATAEPALVAHALKLSPGVLAANPSDHDLITRTGDIVISGLTKGRPLDRVMRDVRSRLGIDVSQFSLGSPEVGPANQGL